MTGLLSLATELLQEIGSELKKNNDKAHARAVCRHLNDVLKPMVFETLKLDIDARQGRLSAGLSLLEALANDNTSEVASFVKNLVIESLYPDPSPGSYEPSGVGLNRGRDYDAERSTETMMNLLEPAISSLKNLQSVKWSKRHYEPEWTFETVTRGLISLPRLQKLEITLFSDSCPNLEYFANLHTLIIQWDEPTDAHWHRCPPRRHSPVLLAQHLEPRYRSRSPPRRPYSRSPLRRMSQSSGDRDQSRSPRLIRPQAMIYAMSRSHSRGVPRSRSPVYHYSPTDSGSASPTYLPIVSRPPSPPRSRSQSPQLQDIKVVDGISRGKDREMRSRGRSRSPRIIGPTLLNNITPSRSLPPSRSSLNEVPLSPLFSQRSISREELPFPPSRVSSTSRFNSRRSPHRRNSHSRSVQYGRPSRSPTRRRGRSESSGSRHRLSPTPYVQFRPLTRVYSRSSSYSPQRSHERRSRRRSPVEYHRYFRSPANRIFSSRSISSSSRRSRSPRIIHGRTLSPEPIYIPTISAVPVLPSHTSSVTSATIPSLELVFPNTVKAMVSIINNSPQLSSLYIAYSRPGADPSGQGMFASLSQTSCLALNHLSIGSVHLTLDESFSGPPFWRSLTSLSLFRLPLNSSLRYLWKVLQGDGVRLKKLHTAAASAEMIEYLASYSGLESIVLTDTHSDTTGSRIHDSEEDILARRFYSEILPAHASSLVELDVQASFEGPWCFSDHAVPALSKCQRLRTLSISMDGLELDEGDIHSVVLLINSVARHPELRSVSLDNASERRDSGRYANNRRCGTHRHERRRRIVQAIKTGLQSMDLSDHKPSPSFAVYIPNFIFKALQDKDDQTLRFCCINESPDSDSDIDWS